MTVNPEVEKKPETPPEGVEHRPEEIGVPERIQDVVKKTPSQVTAQVTDDDDQDLIHTPEKKEIAIEIPGNQASFEQQAQGSETESRTWLAASGLSISYTEYSISKSVQIESLIYRTLA